MAKTSTLRASKSAARATNDSTRQSAEVGRVPMDDARDDADRRSKIAEAAYFRAERRGFAPGFELEDWLLSESELDAQTSAQTLQRNDAGLH